MSEQSRTDFEYRQLENNLLYISEAIIQAFQSGKCDLKAGADDSTDSCWHDIQADMEKSFVEIDVYWNYPYNGYAIRIWDKNTPPSEQDKESWRKRWKNRISCPGHLTWEYSDEDTSHESGVSSFDSGLHKLIYKYVMKLQDVYFCAGSVSSTIKNLL